MSPGCDNCYARTFSHRIGQDIWNDKPRRFFGEKHWNEPLKWEGRVFCASMADVFEMNHSLDVERRRLWDLIDRTPKLTWQLLTKRPENINRLAPASWQTDPEVLKRIWFGTTAEDQTRADLRIPRLLQTDVEPAVRFLSCEPLLGPVDLTRWFGMACPWCNDTGILPGSNWVVQGSVPPNCYHCNGGGRQVPFINWVICGCESGPGARPFDLTWARDIVELCATEGVACFVKQLPGARKGSVIKDLELFPEDLRVREFPEVAA